MYKCTCVSDTFEVHFVRYVRDMCAIVGGQAAQYAVLRRSPKSERVKVIDVNRPASRIEERRGRFWCFRRF